MRDRNHHLIRRGKKGTFHIRYEVPKDLVSPGKGRRTRTESLKTTEVTEARRLRDERMRALERHWNDLRASKRRRERRTDPGDEESIEYALKVARLGGNAAQDYIGRVADWMQDETPLPRSGTDAEYEEAQQEYLASPLG